MGIKEVPVVFVHEDNPVPVIKVEPVVKESANLSSSREKSTVELNNSSTNNSEPSNGSSLNANNLSGNKSNKTNSALGLGLLGSLSCLYCGWRLRKK